MGLPDVNKIYTSMRVHQGAASSAQVVDASSTLQMHIDEIEAVMIALY